MRGRQFERQDSLRTVVVVEQTGGRSFLSPMLPFPSEKAMGNRNREFGQKRCSESTRLNDSMFVESWGVVKLRDCRHRERDSSQNVRDLLAMTAEEEKKKLVPEGCAVWRCDMAVSSQCLEATARTCSARHAIRLCSHRQRSTVALRL